LKDDPIFEHLVLEPEPTSEQSADCPEPPRLSAWVRSPARRAFDIALVSAMLPVLLPILLIVACMVRLTSRGPALFLQKRVGRNGTHFTIYKFRTMLLSNQKRGNITSINDPAITSLGKFLRWWKLDELPQLLNVLRGDMSLVGPRPKVPEQQTSVLSCRPGITGAATIAFAQEDVLLVGIPECEVEDYCRNVLLPMKQSLDESYMARATPLSDLRLLLNTAMRRWDRPNTSHVLEPSQVLRTRSINSLEKGLEIGD
jgi:lipopolysaccharide/colanic/teichoic acid biosynthesis glycosyltransferase